jgi:hypothetical protein
VSLSDRDRAMLEFERSTQGSREGRKGDAIIRTWGCTPSTYFLRLNAILDKPEALVYDAQLVNRLLRLREARRAARSPARART